MPEREQGSHPGRGQGDSPGLRAHVNQRGSDQAPCQPPHGNSSNWSNAYSGRPESHAVKSINHTKAAGYDNNENIFAPAHQQHSETRAMDDAGTAKTNDDAKESRAELSLLSEEDWNRLPVQEKMEFLLPDERVMWRDFVDEFPSDWQKRVEKAVALTLKKTRKEWDDDQKSKNTGSDEIEEEYDEGFEPETPPNMSGTSCTELPLLYVRFIEKLPQCTAMHFGFHVSARQQSKCYCPCSKKMHIWRRQFGLEDIPQCNAKGRFLDYALLDHLKNSHREGIVDFHKITQYYLQNVYGEGTTLINERNV